MAVASLHHEGLIGSYFSHPNAQTAVDHGSFENQPYLILPYVDGGCLADLLTPSTRPPPAVIVTIVLDVLEALGALHQATDRAGAPLGLVHCDVSPENVLVGVDGLARLADFGSTRITMQSEQAHAFQISKPAWMAPEQFTGDRLDGTSDIYSVGLLLWTALTGQQPFAAEVYDQTVMNVMRKNVPPPSTFGAPPILDPVCTQSMSRFRDQRFRVAGAMATALRTSAAGELIASRAEVGEWVRRAMGDDLVQRRQVVASMFAAVQSGTQSQHHSLPRPGPAAPAGDLSAKTLYLPSPGDEEPGGKPPWRSAFWLGLGFAFALALALCLLSWTTPHPPQVPQPRARIPAPAPPPATVPPRSTGPALP